MSLEVLSAPNDEPSAPLRVERLIDHFPIMEEVLEGYEDRIHLVRADDNPAGTFKDRGAKEKITMLYDDGARHIAVASAGNHLRGTIQAAAPLGIRLTGALPATAPEEKRIGSEKLWAECGGDPHDLTLISVGSTYDESYGYLREHLPDLPIVHAFDDPVVIDGRKVLAAEIADVLPDVTYTVSANGGGSLLAALTEGFHDLGMPTTTLGVEARGSDSLSRTLESAGDLPVAASDPNRRYGGLCVSKVGHHAVRRLVQLGFTPDRVTQADDTDVLKLIGSYGENETDYIEPSSVVAVAGLINFINQHRFSGSDTIAVIASGHNEHPHRLLQFPAKRSMRIASAHVLR